MGMIVSGFGDFEAIDIDTSVRAIGAGIGALSWQVWRSKSDRVPNHSQ